MRAQAPGWQGWAERPHKRTTAVTMTWHTNIGAASREPVAVVHIALLTGWRIYKDSLPRLPLASTYFLAQSEPILAAGATLRFCLAPRAS